MSAQNDGGPAWRVPAPAEVSLRDHFAGLASDSDIRSCLKSTESSGNPRDRCRARYRHADFMLAARGAK